MTAYEDARLLVRRARRRLETVRLLKGAARGALAGSVLGLLAMPFGPAALPWALLGAGAAAGLVAALLGDPIDTTAAALYLDRRLGTEERFTTVATLPPDPLTIRVAEEIPRQGRLPRSPVPREAAFVPLAAFLLFAASLLPRVREEAPPQGTGIVVLPAAAEDGAADVATATLEKLARGERLMPEEALALREAIERGVRRPEDRRAAEAALSRAEGGEGASGGEVLKALRPPAPGGGALLSSAYPGAEEFVRAYRQALEEKQ